MKNKKWMATLLSLFVYSSLAFGEIFTTGEEFSTGETVTAQKLEDIVEKATYKSGHGGVYVQAASPNTDSLHLDTDDGHALKYYDGSAWQTIVNSSSSPQAIGVGQVIAVASENVPTGFLECDGSAISRSVYVTLYTEIGVLWGEGNGTTTFNLPDLRGKFMRGFDNTAGNDPNAATRTAQATGGATGDNVGSIQADELKDPSKSFADFNGTSTGIEGGTGAGSFSFTTIGGDETRPINAYVMFCIKT